VKGRTAGAALGLAVSAAVLYADVPKGVETFEAAWTIIRDTHFDTTFNGLDWNAVRAEFRPRAEAAATTGELRGVINSMLARLGQSHFALIPSGGSADGNSEGVLAEADPGFDVRLVAGEILVTAVDEGRGGEVAGVKAGWRLTAIGTQQVSDLLRKLPQTANERLRGLQAWRLMQSPLRGSEGSSVDLTFEDGARQTVQRRVVRQKELGHPVTVGSLPTMYVRVTEAERRTPAGKTAGVIGFNVWMASVDGPFQKAVDRYRSSDGIVLDLRGNPGGLAAMIMGISGHFVDERRPLGIMKTRTNELRFVVNPREVDGSGRPVAVFGGPVAILVDSMSGSASECFAGGMQSIGRVRVFGETSMGQALPALLDKLPNGDVLIHAYGDFVTADGTRLEGRGVIPDEILPVSREDLLAGRDRPLEAALAWIDRAAVRKPQ
jgi:carboxyl-terminal processing protease